LLNNHVGHGSRSSRRRSTRTIYSGSRSSRRSRRGNRSGGRRTRKERKKDGRTDGQRDGQRQRDRERGGFLKEAGGGDKGKDEVEPGRIAVHCSAASLSA